MKIDITKNVGMLLLAIWLILMGLSLFIPAIGELNQILSVLAIAAGVLIMLEKQKKLYPSKKPPSLFAHQTLIGAADAGEVLYLFYHLSFETQLRPNPVLGVNKILLFNLQQILDFWL